MKITICRNRLTEQQWVKGVWVWKVREVNQRNREINRTNWMKLAIINYNVNWIPHNIGHVWHQLIVKIK